MSIRFRIVNRKFDDDSGFDVGVFEIQFADKDKVVNRSKGKFVVVTEKGKDGKWRFAVDSYSSLPAD